MALCQSSQNLWHWSRRLSSPWAATPVPSSTHWVLSGRLQSAALQAQITTKQTEEESCRYWVPGESSLREVYLIWKPPSIWQRDSPMGPWKRRLKGPITTITLTIQSWLCHQLSLTTWIIHWKLLIKTKQEIHPEDIIEANYDFMMKNSGVKEWLYIRVI